MLIRPLRAADEDELRRIHRMPEVVRWWGDPEPGFPASDDPESTRFSIVLEDRIVGLIEYWEELTPRYRHATIDVFLDPHVHGRGLGTEAVRRMVRHLIAERGHHRITIDPAADNAVAIRAYEKVGFKPVGIMRRYERDSQGDGWHDALLMELVAGEELLGEVAATAEPLGGA
jgi:RimJ/RimL family protein N-acetyltransferase